MILLLALVVCVLVALRLQGAGTAQGGGPSGTRAPSRSSSLRGPNFDFDLFRTSPTIPELQSDGDEGPPGDDASEDGDSDADDGESDELADDVLEDDDDLHVLHPPIPPIPPSHAPATRPFLPFTCAASCAEPGLRSAHEQSTCAKYNAPNAPNATYDPFFLDRSVLFPGTGHEVRRVLTRAIKSSLYGTRRRKEGTTSPTTPYEDEEPFQILILGGSGACERRRCGRRGCEAHRLTRSGSEIAVSNCRGVDPYSECWHSRVLDWFQRTLPLEGDPRPVAPEPAGPQRLVPAAANLRLAVERRTVTSTLARLAKRTLAPRAVKPPLAAVVPKDAKHVKAVSKPKSKKKKKKPKSTAPGGRKRPVTRLINGAKSATGSAFYAYCFEAEMAARGKSDKWGKGPDLVVLEFGVNDVWPTSPVASRDFERLLTHLRALPSAPALVILEAASLLLARTQPATTAAEYLHLAPAHFHDVPVLSTKHALFGPATALRPDAGLAMPELFLPDLHHPNARGHELLADTLTAYLEREACTVQRQLQASAQSDDLAPPPRKDELVLPRPARSLFEPFGEEARSSPFEQPAPTCLQVGNSKSKTVPSKNVGCAALPGFLL